MGDVALLNRIHAQLSASARQHFNALSVPPFTIYINSDSDAPWSNYAIPDEPIAALLSDADLVATLDTLCAEFVRQKRQPRFEFVGEFVPTLASALIDYGFVEEMRTQLMICTPATYRAVTSSTQVYVDMIVQDDPIVWLQEFMTVQRRAFGSESEPATSKAEAEQARRRFSTTQYFAAWWGEGDHLNPNRDPRTNGTIVSVASLMPAYDRIAEIAGIATASVHRRQGLAAAVTAHVVSEAFEQGTTCLFLTAANVAAGRVYERVGFYAIGTGLSYRLPDMV